MIELIVGVLLFFTVFFILARIKNDLSLIDVAWGLSFFVIFLLGAQYRKNPLDEREWWVGAMVLLWSVRLSGYILYRNLKLKKEDERYTQMKAGWRGSLWLNAYVRVYLLQALLALVVASPLYLLHQYQGPAWGTLADGLGTVLFFLGFSCEALADWQKHRFKSRAEHRGKVCRVGLWRYSRHPNYFGESLLWWGLFVVITNEVPWYWALWGPALLQFLLLKVSGVAMLEQKYRKDPAYAEYRATTSSFIPWFPKEPS